MSYSIKYDETTDAAYHKNWARELEALSFNKVTFFQTAFKVYHYTPLRSLWSVLEEDTFWATHTQLSNDEEEYQLGMNYIRKVADALGATTGSEAALNSASERDCYMICFCTQENLLSQWREYGRGGVSIELDFSRCSLMRIERNEKKGDFNDELIYALPIHVMYLKDTVLKHVDPCLSEISMSSLAEALQECCKGGDRELISQMLKIVPYIKDCGFAEEREARLIFEYRRNAIDECFYLKYDGSNYRKPHLNIKCGEGTNSACDNIDFSGFSSEEFADLSEKIAGEYPGIRMRLMQNSNSPRQMFISEGCDQETVFNKVYDIADEWSFQNELNSERIKVWCDGHWPIRSIMVGPCIDKSLIRTSIDNFCRMNPSSWWLRDVDVLETDTPYRERHAEGA